jgi:hypothetical protein
MEDNNVRIVSINHTQFILMVIVLTDIFNHTVSLGLQRLKLVHEAVRDGCGDGVDHVEAAVDLTAYMYIKFQRS